MLFFNRFLYYICTIVDWNLISGKVALMSTYEYLWVLNNVKDGDE